MDGPSVNSGQRKAQRSLDAEKFLTGGKNVHWAILKYFTNSFNFAHFISANKNEAEGRRYFRKITPENIGMALLETSFQSPSF